MAYMSVCVQKYHKFALLAVLYADLQKNDGYGVLTHITLTGGPRWTSWARHAISAISAIPSWKSWKSLTTAGCTQPEAVNSTH